MFNIYLKSTTGGDKIPVDVSNEMTIAEVKAAAADKAEVPAENQRLIYKGQVLKDDRTIASYGGLFLLVFKQQVLPVVQSVELTTKSPVLQGLLQTMCCT